MKKFLILIIALPFLAASCDLVGGSLDFSSGAKGVFKSEDYGQTYNTANKVGAKGDLGSLSITALALDPSNADILYAGAAGGIYKSTDAAASWKFILNGFGTAAIAVDPFHPETIYASGISGSNGKIIKSLDGGTVWVDVYNEPSKSNTVTALAVSNASSSTILAGLVSGELIKSTDSGKTWQAVKNFEDKVSKIKFGSNNTAYAMTSKKGLFKSMDFGTNWTDSSSALTSPTFSSANSGEAVTAFFDLALDQKQSGVLYLGTEQGLYRSVNDGQDWSLMALPLKGAALRVAAVAVDPTNSNNLLTAVSSTMYKSTNGGVSWETKVLPTPSAIRAIVINPTSSNIFYLELRAQ